MSNQLQLAVIVLAAGASTRLGHAKQLVEIADKALVTRQCELALTVSDHVTCILGAKADEIRAKIRHLPINIKVNTHWQSGMGSSISTAINSLSENYDAALIMLVDQWLVNRADLNALIRQYQQQPNSIIVSSYHQQWVSFGPPVIFPKQWFKQLSQLNSEQGAKAVINKNLDKVTYVTIENASTDLDTPEQLIQLKQQIKLKQQHLTGADYGIR